MVSKHRSIPWRKGLPLCRVRRSVCSLVRAMQAEVDAPSWPAHVHGKMQGLERCWLLIHREHCHRTLKQSSIELGKEGLRCRNQCEVIQGELLGCKDLITSRDNVITLSLAAEVNLKRRKRDLKKGPAALKPAETIARLEDQIALTFESELEGIREEIRKDV